MEKKEVKELLKRYTSGNVSEEERAIVETWYLRHQNRYENDLSDPELENDLEEIFESLPQSGKSKQRILWYSIAATILIILTFGAIFFTGKNHLNENKAAIVVKKTDIPPGVKQAILILADGSKITLDDAGNGKIAIEANVSISKTADGELVYTNNGSNIDTKPAINSIQTPRGGHYQVVLPDGTRVWLNAASSLRYPTLFTGGKRIVELTGEAYFEVAHNKSMPFIVVNNHQTVEVLGTHFNINSYTDEPFVRTTLVQGSVRVSQGSNSKILKPGQQSQAGESIQVYNVDTEEAIAWKNGDFMFSETDLTSIMRQISNWYDVEVVFQKGIDKDLRFSGLVSRSRNVSAVLRLMELTDQVHFKVVPGDFSGKGRRIIVMP